MKVFYYSDGQIRRGPYSLRELREKRLNNEHYIWTEGLTEWVKASDLDLIPQIIAQGGDCTNFAPQKVKSAPKKHKSNSYDRFKLLGVIAAFYCSYTDTGKIRNIFDYIFHLDEKWLNPSTYITLLLSLTLIATEIIFALSIKDKRYRWIALVVAILSAIPIVTSLIYPLICTDINLSH